MLLTKNFSFKIMLFRKKFYIRIRAFKNARKTQSLHILRGKLNQNMSICVQNFFQNLHLKIDFSSKSCFLNTFFS